jgi:hypothetical protein
MKQEFKKVPLSPHFIPIEQEHITELHRVKYGVRAYPTLVFLTDTNKLLGRLVGFQPAKEINKAIKVYQNSENAVNS